MWEEFSNVFIEMDERGKCGWVMKVFVFLHSNIWWSVEKWLYKFRYLVGWLGIYVCIFIFFFFFFFSPFLSLSSS